MSYYFEVSGRTVWNPALRLGKWYIALSQSAAENVGCPSGLSPADDDTCALDPELFGRFVRELLDAYCSTSHPVLRDLIHGVLLPSLVMAERAGAVLTPNNDAEKDVLGEMKDFARSMP